MSFLFLSYPNCSGRPHRRGTQPSIRMSLLISKKEKKKHSIMIKPKHMIYFPFAEGKGVPLYPTTIQPGRDEAFGSSPSRSYLALQPGQRDEPSPGLILIMTGVVAHRNGERKAGTSCSLWSDNKRLGDKRDFRELAGEETSATRATAPGSFLANSRVEGTLSMFAPFLQLQQNED